MPVLIAGASTDVGRRLARSLLGQGAQVRAFLPEDDPGLRAAGAHVAVGEYDDLGRLESAMEQVHTVIHLIGSAVFPPGRSIEWINEELTAVAVRAAVGAGVTRFLALSELGADPGSANPYLRTRGHADELIRVSGMQYVILRCAPVLGVDTPLGVALGRAGRRPAPVSPGDGRQRLNPVWSGDVAEALLCADTREAGVGDAFDLGGPETLTYDELVRRATGKSRIVHRRSVPGLPRVLADAWSSDRTADASAFLAQFPMTLTALDEALARLEGTFDRRAPSV